MSNQRQHTHWNDVANAWQYWEPPLRPCLEDIRVMESMAQRWLNGPFRGGPKVVLWGVTPEIAGMAWPERTELLAVDRSEVMIDRIWPGNIHGYREAVRGNWLECPNAEREYDAIIGDGVFTLLSFPDEYRALAAHANRVVNENGFLITRLFVLPSKSESPDKVFDDLLAGRIGNFHIFKFRLAMSLQPDAQTGVRMGDIFDCWSRARIDIDEVMLSMRWSAQSIDTINHYENKDSRLSFPRLEEFDEAVEDFFERIECHIPGYEMGDRCPVACYTVLA